MTKRILIINNFYGDALSDGGKDLAIKYEKSDIVYILEKNGKVFQSKYMDGEEISIIKYFDAKA
jgi:hypothetical protein